MKTLYKICILLLMCFAWNNIAVSQVALERIKARRIAFFTNKLQLTPEEAQKFWPVFNEYDKKKNALTIEKRTLTLTFQNSGSDLSEAEIDKLIGKYIQISNQENQLIEEYTKKFRAILPARKVLKLYLAETEFKVALLRELRANNRSDLEE